MVAPGKGVLTSVRRRGNNGRNGKEWRCHSIRKVVSDWFTTTSLSHKESGDGEAEAPRSNHKNLTRYPAPNVPLWCWVTVIGTPRNAMDTFRL
ncbi:MAG: hypothetical protein JJT78_15455 [Leptospira sp.]|nr:hypothetical protein [Leptospira sp.]